MKIDGFQASKLYETYSAKNTQNAAAGAGDKAAAGKMDRVEISSKASDIQTAEELKQQAVPSETLEDRQNRIENIKKMIDAGTYQVDSRQVARSILVGSNLDIRA